MNITTIGKKIINGLKSKDTYGKYLSLSQISHRQKEVMYDIYKQYYHNTNFDLFFLHIFCHSLIDEPDVAAEY